MANMDMASMSNDSFSWRRVMMVARYWWPRLRTKFWIFVGYSILAGLLGGVIDLELKSFKGIVLVSLTVWIAYLSPAVFGKSRGRALDVALPARNSEKMTFLLVYSVMIIPLVTCGVSQILYCLVVGKSFEALMSNEIISGISGVAFDMVYVVSTVEDLKYITFIYDTAAIIFMSLCTLYFSQRFDRNAAIKAIGISICFALIPNFIFGMGVGIYGFHQGFTGAVNGCPEAEIVKNVEDLFIGNLLPIYLKSVMVVYMALIIIFMYLFVKRFPRRQAI